MCFVGGSVAVSGVLHDAPFLTAQALRYGIAFALLLVWVRCTRRRLHRPRGAEWAWLTAVAICGLVLFNVALVYGSQHAEPAVLAVAVACVPIALALTDPNVRILTASAVVSVGAVAVQGVGRCDTTGMLWALVVFGCEIAFTLLALPVLGRHGPEGVSVHTTWLAAGLFAILGLAIEGPAAAASLNVGDMAAIGYLALVVTAVAFVLWYSCVGMLGPSRAGLLTGIAPVAAAATGIALSGQIPAPGVWAGMVLIAAGLGLGLGGRRRAQNQAVAAASCRASSSAIERTYVAER
jgi:drug/metabolite transporter (DMT)-like permease